MGDHPYVCVAFMTISFGFNGAVALTNYVIGHDLAPNYATTIYAIINTAATSAGFISPVIVGFFTKERVSFHFWIL